jgi:acetyl esterase/lipase
MVILRTAGPLYSRFREELAATGLVVVGVEYRNVAGALGSHPFPAGLDDCMTALAWVDAHREELGIRTITVAGESGGGNLTLATALRAKRETKLHMIDGVYALVPYISGIYSWTAAERRDVLPSWSKTMGISLRARWARCWWRCTTRVPRTATTRCAGRSSPPRTTCADCLRT